MVLLSLLPYASTYIWSAAAAAVAVSGCAGDDHGRENDRFVYV